MTYIPISIARAERSSIDGVGVFADRSRNASSCHASGLARLGRRGCELLLLYGVELRRDADGRRSDKPSSSADILGERRPRTGNPGSDGVGRPRDGCAEGGGNAQYVRSPDWCCGSR